MVIRGIERGRIVEDDQDRKHFVSRLGTLAQETETLIYAWSLMTNHAHMLLRSGPSGLPKFMRRLLTGYSVTYNLRHHRSGHLFQNRYRSVVCDGDAYFRELVRYIHLNPLRAGLVRGGLVRSYGGWSAVLSLRSKGEEAETTDERVLGKGDFVERVLREGARWSLHPMRQKEWRR